MADYKTNDIRNIALMGHGGEGKTTLTEAMLYAAHIVDRQGRVEDGNTTTDFEPEEVKRHNSISAAVAPVDWAGKTINVIDIPGYFDFIGEVTGPLRVVETAGIVIGASTGLSVGAEKALKNAEKAHVCKIIIVNQMDKEHANFDELIDQLREAHGSSVVPLILPIGNGPTFKGVVNVLDQKAYEGPYDKAKEIAIPADMQSKVQEAYEKLVEEATPIFLAEHTA